MVKEEFNTSVPLVCSICPKKPNFSDKSHLLTHISSKAHLSAKFKLQIRCQTEPQAREQMSDYDNWYAENGLEDLLSERQLAKEVKNSHKRTRPSSSTMQVASGESSSKLDNTDSSVKQEKVMTSSELYHSPTCSASKPIMQSWASTPRKNDSATTSSRIVTDNNQYETPTTQRILPNFVPGEGAIAYRTRSSSVKAGRKPLQEVDPNLDGRGDRSRGAQSASFRDTERLPKMEAFGTLVDTSKLKGVLWPGMNLFDSATAEMRKNRNQKKDESVLQKMIINSMEVVPDEWIFDADGGFNRKRNLYDLSAENSPVKTEVAPTPRPRKKRTSKKVITLMDLDVDADNIPESPIRPKRRGRPMGKGKNAAAPPPIGTFRPLKYEPTPEEDSEFRLATKDINEHSFNVFRDISPGRTESPLEDMKFDRSDSAMSNPFSFPAFSNDGLSVDSLPHGSADEFMLTNDIVAHSNRPRLENLPLSSMPSNFQHAASMHQPFPIRLNGYMWAQGSMNDSSDSINATMSTSHGFFGNSGFTGGFPPDVFQQERMMNPLNINSHQFSYRDSKPMFHDENIPFAGFGAEAKSTESTSRPIMPAMAQMTVEVDTQDDRNHLASTGQFR